MDTTNPNYSKTQSASGFRKTGVIIILSFVVLLCIVILVDGTYFSIAETEVDTSSSFFTTTVWPVVYTILLNVAVAGITTGAGTVLYAHFDFVQYVKNTLCQVILEHDFVDHLNDNEKDVLMQKLQKHLIYHDKVSGNDTLFDFVNNEVRGLTQEPYYEKMSVCFNCSRTSDRIVKHIIRCMEINVQQSPEYLLDLPKMTRCYFLLSAEEAKREPPFKIFNLTINGQSYTNQIEFNAEDISDERGYECITQYNFKPEIDVSSLIPPDKIIKIYLEYETKVPLTDKTLGFRTYFPCKHLDTTFVYSHDFIVTADVFCFKDRIDGNLDRERIQFVENKNCINITFPDWLLPGDGIIYYIEENNQQTSE